MTACTTLWPSACTAPIAAITHHNPDLLITAWPGSRYYHQRRRTSQGYPQPKEASGLEAVQRIAISRVRQLRAAQHRALNIIAVVMTCIRQPQAAGRSPMQCYEALTFLAPSQSASTPPGTYKTNTGVAAAQRITAACVKKYPAAIADNLQE